MLRQAGGRSDRTKEGCQAVRPSFVRDCLCVPPPLSSGRPEARTRRQQPIIISGRGHRRRTNQTAERPEWAREHRRCELPAMTE